MNFGIARCVPAIITLIDLTKEKEKTKNDTNITGKNCNFYTVTSLWNLHSIKEVQLDKIVSKATSWDPHLKFILCKPCSTKIRPAIKRKGLIGGLSKCNLCLTRKMIFIFHLKQCKHKLFTATQKNYLTL